MDMNALRLQDEKDKVNLVNKSARQVELLRKGNFVYGYKLIPKK